MDLLSFLYETIPGRLLLRPLCSPLISRAAGAFLDSRLSWPLVRPFARKYGIDPSEFLLEDARSFNDFFSRKFRPGHRPVDQDPAHLVAPCDGLLTVHPITEGLVLPVKQSAYQIRDLLRDEALARQFHGGYCFVFRLCVEHYHRYIYAGSGEKAPDRSIPGVLHTVRPVALRRAPVFCENSREYTLLHTERLGTLVQMEVGAMLVGRIVNHQQGSATVLRGQEKGCFQYGGSTVILLTQPGKAVPLPRFSAAAAEVSVRLGEVVGTVQSGS